MTPMRARDPEDEPGLWSLQDAARIIRHVDRVELKLMVPHADRDRLMAVLRVDPDRTRRRQVYFLDTNRLALARRGVVVRARRSRRGTADLVVKLRLRQPILLPVRFRRSPNFSVEADALPDWPSRSAALTRKVGRDSMAAVIKGRQPPAALLSSEQRQLLREPVGKRVALGDLGVLGPVEIVRAPAGDIAPAPELVLESWAFPDGSRLLEVSTKCSPTRVAGVAARTTAFLAEHGIDVSAAQHTKSRTSLEYFTRGSDGRPDW